MVNDTAVLYKLFQMATKLIAVPTVYTKFKLSVILLQIKDTVFITLHRYAVNKKPARCFVYSIVCIATADAAVAVVYCISHFNCV
jgi:hypothetical protein